MPQEPWFYNVREGGEMKVQSGEEEQEEDKERDNEGVVTITQRGADEMIMQESGNWRQGQSREWTGKFGNPSILCCDCQEYHHVYNDRESFSSACKLCFGHWRRKTISCHIYPFNTEGKSIQDKF